MCGIFGVSAARHFDSVSVSSRVREALTARGPDNFQSKLFATDNLLLCHSRLSIIDLDDRSNQPFSYRHLTITYNGELYNYLDLRRELSAMGYKFTTGSDTEVFIIAFYHWGPGAFNRFNGMFSAAIYDNRSRTVLLARDRLGEKPLFYAIKNGVFVFGSTARSVYYPTKELVDYQIDYNALASNVHSMWNQDLESTNFLSIYRLIPGSYMVVSLDDRHTVTYQRYWSLTVVETPNKSELVDRYESLLRESVKMRRMSDVGSSLLLSGGLDSSLLAAYMASYGDPLETFTISLDSPHSEERYAKEVCRELCIKNNVIALNNDYLFQALQTKILVYDDLSSYDPGFLTMSVAAQKIATSGSRVVIVGEGSDEINAGYSKFALGSRAFSFSPELLRDFIATYLCTRNAYNIKELVRGTQKFRSFLESEGDSYLRRLQKYDITLQLPNHLLPKVDRAFMDSSIEARSPFLDYRLVELAYSMPNSLKISLGKGILEKKILLKSIASKLLPNKISSRRKFGMMLPIDKFLLDNRASIKETFNRNHGFILSLLKSKRLAKELTMNPEASSAGSWLAWRVLLTTVWHEAIKL